MDHPDAALGYIREVFEIEAAAVSQLKNRVGEPYIKALDLILRCEGKVVTTGVGKSAVIARKMASTFSSTGTPAIFLHPTDAIHGDLGMISQKDVVVCIGKSGESEELTALVPAFKDLGVPLIAITGSESSTLGQKAEVVLDASVDREACPHDLAPTASVIASLAIADALAMALMRIRNFQPQDFARFHPGGRLGKRLLLKVSDVAIPLDRCYPLNPEHATLEEVMATLGKNLLGVVLFSKDGKTLDGILTDGDLRRALAAHKSKIFEMDLARLINRSPQSVDTSQLATEALRFMEDRERPLNVAPVLAGKQMMGAIRLHDLVRAL